MPQYGIIQRTTPIMRVLRGWGPMEPHALTKSYPVASGVTIVSGQLIHPAWVSGNNRYEWNLGAAAAGAGPSYFAQDDSTKEDVIEAGVLVGLSCSGDYELQTAFYTTGNTYNDGTPLTGDTGGNLGTVVPTTVGSGSPIVGYVSGCHGPISLVGIDSSATNLNVIQLTTRHEANAPSAGGAV